MLIYGIDIFLTLDPSSFHLLCIINLETEQQYKYNTMPEKTKSSKKTNSQETRRKVGRVFAEQLITRLKEISASDWKKGWVDGPKGIVPQNIQGRPYTGGNPFFLLMDTAEHRYAAPIYATDKMIFALNDRLRGQDGRIPEDKLDQIIHVKKGEHAVPVLYWLVNIKDKDGKKITMDDYDKLSSEEKKACDTRFSPRYYRVFNIDQTNMSEVAPDRYHAIIDKVPSVDYTNSTGMYSNAALDRMFNKQEWLCPVHVNEPRSDCYYRPSEDAIYGPMKAQFKLHDAKEPDELYKDGMEFYASIVHEMAHSTGSPTRLDREKGKRFGDDKYAKEELVAEITAAMTGSILGFDKRIKDNNTAYVKGWLNALHEEPEFILTVMSDVEKASNMILTEVDKQNQKLAAEHHVNVEDKPLADTHVAKQMPEQQVASESEAQKTVPDVAPVSVDVAEPKLYDVYAMKNGQREAIKTGLTMAASVKFVERNDDRYQRKGYDYLISMPQERKSMYKSIPEKTEVVKEPAPRKIPTAQEHETHNDMTSKKDQEATQQAAEAQKEAQKQKEQSEKQKQAQEQAKRQQEQAQKEKQKASQPDAIHKIAAHAAVQSAILITALEYAKAHKGMFLNHSGKAAPEIVNSKTSLTPYNQVMLALKSDQEGWRTNAYTFMKPAADAGMPVRKGEKATPANWVQWGYKNIQTGKVISSKDFSKVPETEHDLYERTHERKSYSLFNIDQTVMNAKDHDEYVKLVSSKGQNIETLKDFKHDSPKLRTNEVMTRLPHSVVLYKNGDHFEAYGDSAKKLKKLLGDTTDFKTQEAPEDNGKKSLIATFPESRFYSNLQALNAKGERVAFLDDWKDEQATFIKKPIDPKAVVMEALQEVDKVGRTAGIKTERTMRDINVEYSSVEDAIFYTDTKGADGRLSTVDKAIAKANDLYRSLVTAINSDSRLAVLRTVNMSPDDAAAHAALVRDLAAGVLMTRHGLPSTLSVDTMNSLDHLINELKENPNKINLLERGVNNAIEVIDKAKVGRKVDYEKIRGEKTTLSDSNAMNFSIIRSLQSMPNKDTKEIVVIRDKGAGKADVILPQGASLEANNEAPGMSKLRITKALSKEGINDVTFYNARGGLGLNQPNDYFKGKDITLSKLKQYELLTKKPLDVSKAIAQSNDVKMEKFRSIKDDNGKYVFFLKPAGQKSFSIQPSKEDVTKYYDAVRTLDKNIIASVHNELSQKYYRIGTNHPEYQREVIMPDTSKVDAGKVKIEHATLTRDKSDNNLYIQARVDGKFMRQPATKEQMDKMFLADDMQAYKNAVAALAFAPKIEQKQTETQTQTVSQSAEAAAMTVKSEEAKDGKSEDKDEKNTLGPDGKAAGTDKTDVPEESESEEQSQEAEESEEEEEKAHHSRGL